MNLTFVEVFPVSTDLISDEDYAAINNILSYVMLFISVTGVVTNAINIRAFVVMGLADGISVSLLGLSLADFGYAACWTSYSFGKILHIFERQHGLATLAVQPVRVISFLTGNASKLFHEIICLTTAFLGVARCLCVAMPFRFKRSFTRSRSLVAQIIFLIIGLASYLPVLLHMGTEHKFDPVVNRTRIVLWISSRRAAIKNAVMLFHFIGLATVTSAVAFVCVWIMIRYLKQSVRFRDLSSAKSGETQNDVQETSTKLSGKELQAVRQVVMICIIFTASMIPGLVHAFYKSVNLDFEVEKGLSNFYVITTNVQVMFSLMNSASTFFIYYAYNSKFRSVWFACGRVVKKIPSVDG